MVNVTTLHLDDIFVGTDFNVVLQYKNDGVAVDITDYGDILFTARANNNSTNILDDVACTISDAANGKFSLNLSSSQTGSLTAGTLYRYQILITDDNGETEVYAEGTFTPKEKY